MTDYQMIRVLKDPLFNYFPSFFFCCSRPLLINRVDDYVVQHTTSNTTYFSDDRLEGLQMETVSRGEQASCQCCCRRERPRDPHGDVIGYYEQFKDYYGFQPIEIKAMRLDWLLEEVGELDKQPRGIKMLTEIHNWTAKTDDLKYFEIPAVQCIIQFFYQKLVKYEFSPINFTTQVLDLVQVLLQIGAMNNLIYRVTEQTCDEDSLAPGETCDWDDGTLHAYT